MKTGLTMTAAAVSVMAVGLIFSNSIVIKEMFLIILIALIMDVPSTYLTNAGILKIYCKRKKIE
jgi:preprotein translocase subunit SecF